MATSKRGNPVARAGNYAQEADSVGMDSEMKDTLFGGKPTPMTKVESDYVKGKGNSDSSKEAVRRARKANRQPPVREY